MELIPVIEEKDKQLIEQDKQLSELAAIIQKYKEKYGELWHVAEVAPVWFDVYEILKHMTRK